MKKNAENLSQNYPLETTFCLETSFSVMSRLVIKKNVFCNPWRRRALTALLAPAGGSSPGAAVTRGKASSLDDSQAA